MKNIVYGTPLTVYTDLYVMIFQDSSKITTGILGSLISVEYIGCAMAAKSTFQN